MHILIIPSWYKTPGKPIVGTFFEEQARMFHKRGHQVAVLYPYHNLRFLSMSRFGGEKTPKTYNDKGILTMYAFSQSYIPNIETPTQIDILQCCILAYRQYRMYRKLYGKPDIIHAHSVIWGGVVASYISKKEKIPFFVTKHFSGWILDIKRLRSNVYRELLAKTIKKSAKTLVVSSFYKDELLNKYNIDEGKMSVIHNIVSSLFFENPQIIKKSNPIHLTIIAYLTEKKNHLTLFKAIKLLKNKGISIVLTVIGNGPYIDVLKAFVEKEQLMEIILFLGLLDRNDIVEEIKKSHIVVSASTFETFGVNIIEGLACGRPCVVLDSGGPRDIVRNEDGILCEENTPEAFANSIKNLIYNYDDYDQIEIRNACENRFGENYIYEQLLKEYFSN